MSILSNRKKNKKCPRRGPPTMTLKIEKIRFGVNNPSNLHGPTSVACHNSQQPNQLVESSVMTKILT